MSTENKLLAATKLFLEQEITQVVGKLAYGWPVLLPNRTEKKVYPCITIEIEDSEESIPNTGNMDTIYEVSIESPYSGKDKITEADHRSVVEQVYSALCDNAGFRAMANDGTRAFSPFFCYRTYVMSAIPDPTASKKILTSTISMRAVHIGGNG